MKLNLFFFLFCFMIINPADARDTAQKENVIHQEDVKQDDQNFALGPVILYQKHLSPVIGGNCPMVPSCSHYSSDAIKEHGALLGWIMTCDRLMRCSRDELNQSESIRINQQTRCYDPVSKNDFWLK